MKNHDNMMPDTETIKRYWGSAEAYMEEQRRTALVDFEEGVKEPSTITGWNWDFGTRVGRAKVFGVSRGNRGGLRSFRLFGR